MSNNITEIKQIIDRTSFYHDEVKNTKNGDTKLILMAIVDIINLLGYFLVDWYTINARKLP
jgi:hypothetical protein